MWKKCKYWCYFKWITVGSNVCIDDYVHISAGKINGFRGKIRTKKNKYFNFEEGEVIVGSNVHIAHYAYINGGVCIMDAAGLGARATIYSITNLFNNPKDKSEMINMGNQTKQESQLLLSSPVVLMENSHLLYTSIAFPGVAMMKNSIVMPLSKVVGNIYENNIVEGNPAVKIDTRNNLKKIGIIVFATENNGGIFQYDRCIKTRQNKSIYLIL